MSYREALKRALAHAVVGAGSTPLSSAVFDVEAWKLAAAAAVGAVINFAVRAAQAYLDARKTS